MGLKTEYVSLTPIKCCECDNSLFKVSYNTRGIVAISCSKCGATTMLETTKWLAVDNSDIFHVKKKNAKKKMGNPSKEEAAKWA